MKIILTHGYFLNEDPKELQIMKPYVPLGILYISSFLEDHGFENTIFDSTFSSFDTLTKHLIDERPDVLAIYTNLMTKLNVLKIIRFVKNTSSLKHTQIILGGPEVTHHVDSFLNHGANYIVIGEGEQTTLELIIALKEKQNDLSKLKGIAFLDNHTVVKTAERPLIKDINSLPFPNHQKINFTPYLDTWKKHHGFSMMSVSTMRGCPYTCKWCSRAVYGGTYRRRSPSLVVDELVHLKENYNPDMIWFVDDVFTIHHKWLNEFADEVKKRNAIIPYEIISRADRLNEDVIKTLKASGCYRIWIGAESGSQTIIDAMDRRVDVLKTREMIQLTKKHGIEAGTFIMLGYPGETKQNIQETITHLIESNPTFYTITIAYPIKGTPLYTETQSIFNKPLEWSTSTDRDIDFKRNHTRQFYEYGIRWVAAEVALKTKKNGLFKRVKLKTKSLVLETLMTIEGFKKS